MEITGVRTGQVGSFWIILDRDVIGETAIGNTFIIFKILWICKILI